MPTRRRALLALVVAACCLALVAAWWTKGRCLADGTWTGGEEYTRWCYSDVFPLWFAERLHEGAVPYLDHPVEYPVLTGAQMYLAQQVVELADDAAARPRLFYDVTAVLNAASVLGVLALLAAAGLHPRRLLWWAVAPTTVVYATLNWDPLAILCLVAAIVLHRRGRDGLAGLAAGLGVAAKLLPGVVIPFVVLTRLRQGDRRSALVHVAAAAGAWAAVNLPVALVAPEGWRRFFDLNRERPPDFDSLWFLAERVRGTPLPVADVNLWSALVLGIGAAVIVVVGTRHRPPEAWWELTLPVLCWFLLTNKVYSPQYSLWLLPLCALVLRRLAPFAAFLVADLMVFAIRFPFFLGLTGSGLQAPNYDVLAVALLLRAGLLGWILVESTLDHDPSLLGGRGRAVGGVVRRQPGTAASARSPSPAS